jgi:hypothetical protein
MPPKSGRTAKRQQHDTMWKALTSGASLIFLLAWFAVVMLWPTVLNLDLRERFGRREALDEFTGQRAPQSRARTLVVYVFSGSDPEYVNNLRFFIREAVKVASLLQQSLGCSVLITSCGEPGS